MYYCNDCEEYFEDPVISEVYPETDKAEHLCPWCGSDYLEEAHLCACGENYTTEGFCKDCYEKVRFALNKLKCDLGFKQDDFEQIISNHFGW